MAWEEWGRRHCAWSMRGGTRLDYTALLFVGAGSPTDLRRNLAALCDRRVLDLPEQEAPEEEVREVAVLRWLRERSRDGC